VTEPRAAASQRSGAGRAGVLRHFLRPARRWVFQPLLVATACCAEELMAPGEQVWEPRHADLLIVAGPVNRLLAPRLRQLHQQMPAPQRVLALGTCACSGGPWCYPGSPVLRGLQEVLPVDLLVPGCPFTPESLAAALTALEELDP
jgi:NADH-quinone oxidoreductase subunit B